MRGSGYCTVRRLGDQKRCLPSRNQPRNWQDLLLVPFVQGLSVSVRMTDVDHSAAFTEVEGEVILPDHRLRKAVIPRWRMTIEYFA